MPIVEVFYSLRSPYCYLLTPRLVELESKRPVQVVIRPVYPIAVRDPSFFTRVDPLYRSYHLLDSARVASALGIPYRRPIPDPIVQNLETSELPDEQPYIHRITRLAAAASEMGDGLSFVNEVMTMIWDGRTDNWHEGDHLALAMRRAGLDPDELEGRVRRESNRLDSVIEANQGAQREAGHWGVPLAVFDGEPFYGQDRFPHLLAKLDLAGVRESGSSR